MATLTILRRGGGPPVGAAVQVRMPDWMRAHRTSIRVVTPLLALVGVAHAWNMYGWPGRINDDEGTYVAQAWAVLYRTSLAHYTYWYDHPPLGWLMIALYSWVTEGFDRTASALMVGREVMLITQLVCCGLLYLLARRLGMHRAFAVITVLAFAFSPLAMQYHRMVFLDNMAVAYVLAAFVLAASPRRSLAAALGSGVCFAGAILTKETVVVLFPAVVWMLLQHTDKRTRQWSLTVWCCATVGVGFLYPLYAILKNELLPGPGHVSLEWALWWQVFGRGGSGSLLDTHSGTYGLAHSWVDQDPWLLLAGVALIPVGLCIRMLRPAAAALLMLVLTLFRGGYVPYPYVIALLPFAALLIGGVGSSAWRGWRASRPPRHPRSATTGRCVLRLGVVALAILFAVIAAPVWGSALHRSTTVDLSGPPRQATEWVLHHVDRNAVIIVDDYVWTDLALHGYTKQIWLYKADLDPAVHEGLLPHGYASVAYVVLGTLAESTLRDLPTVAQAIQHSRVMATFGGGEITVRKVIRPSPS